MLCAASLLPFRPLQAHNLFYQSACPDCSLLQALDQHTPVKLAVRGFFSLTVPCHVRFVARLGSVGWTGDWALHSVSGFGSSTLYLLEGVWKGEESIKRWEVGCVVEVTGPAQERLSDSRVRASGQGDAVLMRVLGRENHWTGEHNEDERMSIVGCWL